MTHPLFDLTGRVALVTGGSKGLGKAMARGFAEAGANIVISQPARERAEIGGRRDRRGYEGQGASTSWPT